MAHEITIIPGDGIGPEISQATLQVLEATGVELDWVVEDAGMTTLEREGTVLPDRVLESVRRTRVALKGPITTPIGTGFRSVNVALRHELDLFAAIRPSRTLPGVVTRYDDVDLVVIRENTEDLYAGIEFEAGTPETAELRSRLERLAGADVRDDAGITVKPISVTGARRIVRFAFEFARAQGRRKVTLGHKANIMRFSDGIFLEIALEEAPTYADLAFEEMQIDQLSMRLTHDPETFDVLLLPNLYGDILSDLCAGLVGGPGLAAGANLGWEYAVFEPVHGSAPDIAGRGVANPLAMIHSAGMMLSHLRETAAAARLAGAVDRVLRGGAVRTPDLGGAASTTEVSAAVSEALRDPGPVGLASRPPSR